jgi:hypothetical protein
VEEVSIAIERPQPKSESEGGGRAEGQRGKELTVVIVLDLKYKTTMMVWPPPLICLENTKDPFSCQSTWRSMKCLDVHL